MRIGASSNPPAAAGDFIETRLFGQKLHLSVCQEYAALVRSIRMQVHEYGCIQAGRFAGSTDRGNNLGQSPAAVKVPVGEKDALDSREFNIEAPGIVQPNIRIGANIEKQRTGLVTTPPSNQYGKTMASTAHSIEHNFARLPLINPAHRRSRCMLNNFGDLRCTVINAG